jgi:hypothetical protein
VTVTLLACTLSGCGDFVVVDPTPTPAPAGPTLPPIGFNHRYGNSPVAAADGFDLERLLFSQQVFWEVGVRADPQVVGFVDRANAAAVAQARAKFTTLVISVATERLQTIRGMLAFPTDAAQEQYCIALLGHLRTLGYSNLTKATILVFFTEQDEHAVLDWTPAKGYKYTVNDSDLRGNGITSSGAPATPLPAPG